MIQKLVELVFVVYRATIDERLSKEERISVLNHALGAIEVSGEKCYYVPDLIKDYIRLKIKEINDRS